MRRARDTRNPDFPLEWERVLWSGRAGWLAGRAHFGHLYHVTDLRVVIDPRRGPPTREIAVVDIGAVQLRQSFWQRLAGTSTVIVHSRRGNLDPLVLADIYHGPHLAVVLQLLSDERPEMHLDTDFVQRAIPTRTPDPFVRALQVRFAAAALIVLAAVVTVASLRVSQRDPGLPFAADDPIAPGGHKRDRAAIIAFMERDVMPVARRTLGPLKGGEERVTCGTCHGKDGDARGWRMPGVQALPDPDLRLAGLERSSNWIDAQMRNAIYGYLADEDKQGTVAYMRGIVLPEIAKVLRRPAYDFTQSYDYNVSRGALGCYHCHQVN